MKAGNYNIKKIILVALWSLLAIGGIALLLSAFYKRDDEKCKGVNIELNSTGNYFFIDSVDILKIITTHEGKDFIGKPIRKFDLGKTEKELMKDTWVRKAQLFFDNNGILTAEIVEREPVARVFTAEGNSFYIDEEKNMLPLSERHAARLPIFTNFPSELKVLSKQDSILLNGIKSLSTYIQNDKFLMAMIDQIAINSLREFELVPKIGNQVIEFGDANDIDAKFQKLKLFYKKVIPISGWSKYNKVDLKYKGQIVARINATQDVIADSIRTMEMMKAMASMSMRNANDSSVGNVQESDSVTTDVSIILKSFQRDDEEVAEPVVNAVQAETTKPNSNQPVQKTTAPKSVAKPAKITKVVKPQPLKPVQSKPKAINTSKKTNNEY